MKRIVLLLFFFCFFLCKSQTNDSLLKHTPVEEQAQFPGGFKEMQKYINDNLRLLLKSVYINPDVNGKVYIKFVINESGAIENVQILKGINNCRICGDAAIQVISSMPAWQPAKMDGRPVKAYYNLPISFCGKNHKKS